jgi:hypothetical protein
MQRARWLSLCVAGQCTLMRIGAAMVDEIKNQLLGSVCTVPKTSP